MQDEKRLTWRGWPRASLSGSLVASTYTLLLIAGSAAHGAQLPQGESPKPAGAKINVVEHGADPADGPQDDTDAVNAAIAAATDNSILYFPAGTYNVRALTVVKGFTGLSIVGDGAARSIIKRMGPFWRPGDEHTWENLRANYATDGKILLVEDCTGMCIRDIAFDANGTPTFGGVGITRPRRLNITHTRTFDSGEQPPLFGCDRFGYIVGGYEQGSEDIWFTDNVVEGLQTEMDSSRRALVERNVFRRSVKSPGLGFLSGDFGQADQLQDGYSNTDITIRHNYFTNSDNLSMGMVTFQLDPPTNCNSIFRDIDILDNVFVYDIGSSVGHCAIKLGTGNNSIATTGNVFERIRIEGNRIYRKPGLTSKDEFPGYIWFNGREGLRLKDTTIRSNPFYSDGPGKPLLYLGPPEQSTGLVVEDNLERPYEAPPSPSDVFGVGAEE